MVRFRHFNVVRTGNKWRGDGKSTKEVFVDISAIESITPMLSQDIEGAPPSGVYCRLRMRSGEVHVVAMNVFSLMEKLGRDDEKRADASGVAAGTPPKSESVGVGGNTAVPPSVWRPLAALRGLTQVAEDLLGAINLHNRRYGLPRSEKITGPLYDNLSTEVAFAKRVLTEAGEPPDYRATPEPSLYSTVTTAARDVLEERRRQVEVEGFTAKDDDGYIKGELARAAAAFALYSSFAQDSRKADTFRSDRGLWGQILDLWPRTWTKRWWKPQTPRRDLVRAGALILAEIERLDRAEKALQGEE